MKPSRLLEIKALIVIALPLIFAYLADVMMIITAKMVVGRLGAIDLAAAGISTDLSYQMCIILMGFFSVVGVLVSEARGALNRERIVPELVRGMILSGLLGLAVTVIVLNLGPILRMLGQQPQVQQRLGGRGSGQPGGGRHRCGRRRPGPVQRRAAAAAVPCSLPPRPDTAAPRLTESCRAALSACP